MSTFNSTESAATESSWFTWTYGLAFGAVAFLIIFLLFILFRFIWKRRKKREQKTLPSRPTDPWLTGVIAEQHIQFVVPTIPVSETTEDSMSEADFFQALPPKELDRLRRRNSVTFFINPNDLQKGLYVEDVPRRTPLLRGLGRVGFSLHYAHLRQQLGVRLIGAADLPSSFSRDTANPFAKVVLMPDKNPKFLTKIQRNTVNPVFNETFVFNVKKDDLIKKELKISIWDHDRFSKKTVIGVVRYMVKDARITNAIAGDWSTGDIWIDLGMDIEASRHGCGELLFSLCYNPDTSTLTIVILKTRALEASDKIQTVYVKVALYVCKRVIRTSKSSTKKKSTTEIEFGDPFHIRAPQSALPDIDLVISVFGRVGRVGRQLIGRTQVGANCTIDQGNHHWNDMISSPRSTAAQWHTLSC